MANTDEITADAESPTVLIDYQKSAVAEGRTILFWLIVSIVGLAIFEYFLFPRVWLDDRVPLFGPAFIIMFFTFEILIASYYFYVAILHLRSPKFFRCRLDTKHLLCEAPIPAFMDSLLLPIAKIARITKTEREGNPPYNYALWDRAGRRYRLPLNYGNPVKLILTEIRRLRPDLPEPEYEK